MKDYILRRTARYGFSVALGALVILGISYQTSHYLDSRIKEAIRENVIWKPDSPKDVDDRYRWNNFTDSVPDYLSVYLFNITNVDDIRQGAKPRLEEVGPFTYLKYKVKLDVWWDRAGRVSAKEYDYFIPVPERTAGNLSDTIITLNMPLIGVVENVHAKYGTMAQKLLDLVVSALAGWRDGHVNGLFVSRTAGELIFGYEDMLLHRLTALLPRGSIPTTRVELLHNMTGPEEGLAGPSAIYNTGWHDWEHVWNIEEDNGLTETRCWNNCTERVRGSDGTQFRPGVSRGQVLEVWSSQIARAIRLVFKEEQELLGVHLLRFWPDPAQSELEECHFQGLRGLMNITSPRAVGPNGTVGSAAGPPLYVSPAHFCMCDESLAAAVEGLACDMARHTTFIDIEPITGVSMRGHQAVMLSSEITRAASRHFEPALDKLSSSSTIMPVFWMEEVSEITPPLAHMFTSRLYRALWAQSFLRFWPPLVGWVVLVVASVTAATAHYLHRQHFRSHADGRYMGRYTPATSFLEEEGFDAGFGRGSRDGATQAHRVRWASPLVRSKAGSDKKSKRDNAQQQGQDALVNHDLDAPLLTNQQPEFAQEPSPV